MFFAVFCYLFEKTGLDVLLNAVGIYGRVGKRKTFIELWEFFKHFFIHFFPQSAIFEVEFGARNRVIKLKVGIILFMIVDGIDSFIVGECFR